MTFSMQSLAYGLLVLAMGQGLGLVILARILRKARRSAEEFAVLNQTLENLHTELASVQERLRKLEAPPASEAPQAWPRARSSVRVTRRADAAESGRPRRGPTLITVPSLAASPVANAVPSAREDLGERHAPIWNLADSGVSADEIARITGQPIGQVELILALRQHKASKAGMGGASHS